MGSVAYVLLSIAITLLLIAAYILYAIILQKRKAEQPVNQNLLAFCLLL